jgi:DNA sulfur modification protein DndB
VPAALLLDIKQLAEIESEKESLLRTFFDRLQTDSQSALNGKLSPAKSTPHRISRVAFNRSINAALNSEVVRSLETEDIYRLIRNYINAFEAELPEKPTLTKASYFEAIFEMFDEVVRATMTSYNNVKLSSLQETIRVLANIDFAARGKLTKKGYTDLMQPALRKGVALSADML